jgi:phosphoglucosamine mutase
MKTFFGTDGIRGVAGEPPLDRDTLWRVGVALAETGYASKTKPRVLFGRDTRISGGWIVQLLQDALAKAGIEAISDAGIISTPGLAYLTRLHQYDLGVMISASHNPYRDNGIKIFGQDGFKLSDEEEMAIERRINVLKDRAPEVETTISQASCSHSPQLVGDYLAFLKEQMKGSLNSLRVGLDVCNGSASAIAPEVFEALGATVSVINNRPDGRNINLNCGSLHLSGIVRLVKEQQLDLGVAFDGDADRSLFVTASGKIFDGDAVLYAFSLHFQANRALRVNRVVGTVMSNCALELALKQHGIELLRAAVGDRYVLEMMRQVGANLGGEPSGHIVLSDRHTTGDGILTAVKLTEILSTRKVGLDELADGFRPYPQVLEGLRVRSKIPLENSPEIGQMIEAAEEQLKGKGRIVVRYSGTEPLLRIMAEGEDHDQVEALVSALKSRLASVLASASSSD